MKCPNCGSEVSETAQFCPNCGASIAQMKIESEAKQLYCRNCGAKLPEGASYCIGCGTPVAPPPPVAPMPRPERVIRLAGWGERFIAWLIDIIIIEVVLAPIKWFLALIGWPAFLLTPGFLRWIPFVDFGLDNVIHFLYWTFLEGTSGQSIGKMAMKIRVTQVDGKPADITHIAIGAIGKAFLLPIDCIIGWILYSGKSQRLFNYISETIVVKV